MRFQKGEKVKICAGKYRGYSAHIYQIHIGFKPVHYSCKSIDGKDLLYREDELQSLYQHDIEMLKGV